MSVKEMHDAGIELYQDLLPKSCRITYPKNSSNKRLRLKKFDISRISAGAITNEQLKRLNYTNSKDTVRITFRLGFLEDVKDTTDTYEIPTSGFKHDNVFLDYKMTEYIIFKEEYGEFDTTITLYCEASS